MKLQRLAEQLELLVQRLLRPLFAGSAVLIAGLFGLLTWWLHKHPAAVFTPHGQVASQERSLIFVALILSVIVVVPVFGLTIGIVLKYREGNQKTKKYTPDWDGSRRLESIWWGVPGVIILILSVLTWTSSHQLDPYRALVSAKKPLQIQVVSLDWKWLFIYPDQRVATVNDLPLPVNTPVDFELTSGSVMNSFWIPQLGSQIYTMPGMTTQLHMMGTQVGDYDGSSANISGKGFADMHFKARVLSDADFQSWLQQAQQTGRPLDNTQYQLLLRQAVAKQTVTYRNVSADLYDNIMMPFMMPMGSMSPSDGLMQPSENQPQNPDGTPMPGMEMN